jgi:4-hydroxy-4-methyl-2-oxoglutarate aldolase
MSEWNNDSELFSLLKETLYTPVVGDILDQCGRLHQLLPQAVRPLRDDMKVAGRAMPVRMSDVHGPQKKPFGLLTEALDDLEPGEVYVCGGGAMSCAYWGELLTATARRRGAVGAIIDGFHLSRGEQTRRDFVVSKPGDFCPPRC